MVKALFDTNILIDYLNGKKPAKEELARYKDKAISLITWMEVMVGSTPTTERMLGAFLNHFTRLPIDDEVAGLAVQLRRDHKLKIPDAIIWATAIHNDRILISRNTKDFDGSTPGIRIPYSL